MLRIGSVAEQMGDLEHAATAYENALRHNPMSIPGLTQVAGIARIKENYPMVRSFTAYSLGLNMMTNTFPGRRVLSTCAFLTAG
jgi:general transcriptional corepressor CYC8